MLNETGAGSAAWIVDGLRYTATLNGERWVVATRIPPFGDTVLVKLKTLEDVDDLHEAMLEHEIVLSGTGAGLALVDAIDDQPGLLESTAGGIGKLEPDTVLFADPLGMFRRASDGWMLIAPDALGGMVECGKLTGGALGILIGSTPTSCIQPHNIDDNDVGIRHGRPINNRLSMSRDAQSALAEHLGTGFRTIGRYISRTGDNEPSLSVAMDIAVFMQARERRPPVSTLIALARNGKARDEFAALL